MFKKEHVQFKHVEKLACSFQCMSKKLHCEKFAGRTTTFLCRGTISCETVFRETVCRETHCRETVCREAVCRETVCHDTVWHET